MNDSDTLIEAALCGLLRDDPVTWPAPRSAALDARVSDSIVYHGVGPLLSRKLPPGGCRDSAMPAFQELTQHLRDDTAIELLRKRQLARALSALAESGVTPLLLKGAALAYSIYPSPALRPRADTDLLIRNEDRALSDSVLSGLGYEKPNAISGDIVKYQRGYVLRDGYGIEHVLDVHWRISNTQLFSRALDYAELKSRSVAIVELGQHARGLAPADALLHACMHRAHHMHSPMYVEGVPRVNGDRLIWLYDMHLLVNAMSFRQLVEFAERAGQKGMRAICRDALLRARRCFGTQIHEEVLAALASTGRMEPSRAHLQPGAMGHLLTELRSLPRWRDRITLLREHLFPPVDYMREKYAVGSPAWLPVLYLKRGLHGAWKRMQTP